MLDGSSIKLEEVNKQLLEAGIFRWNQQDDLNKFNLVYENIDTLCEIDFAKTISSKKHNNIKASIIRLGDSVIVVKNNPYMNENVVYTSMNGTQARDMILEFLNYDISESMSDFLSVEEGKIKQLEAERRTILNKIEDCQEGIRKIEESQNDILLSNSEEITLIKRELKREINKLKSEYADKTNAIKSLSEYYVEGSYSDDDDSEFYTDEEMEDSDYEMNQEMMTESKKAKGGKGISTFVQETPERLFNVGDQVETAEYGVGKITAIDAAQKIATVIFNDGGQSKFDFPELRLASQEEIQDEETYTEDMEELASMKKKKSSTFVQELPQRDFQVGETVMVVGKGIGKITAIDSIRHIAIVMMQNGQQSEEEFSNLKSQESEIESQEEDNYIMGIEMGSEPSSNFQPFESMHSEYIEDVEDIEDIDDIDIEENPDYSKEEPTMRDMEIAKKWSSVPNSFKKYLEDSLVKDPYRYSPEEEDKEWDPEYSPLDSHPEKFMDTELDQEEVEMKESDVKMKSMSPLMSSNIKFYSEPEESEMEMEIMEKPMPKVSFIVSDLHDGDLSGQEVFADEEEYEMANENDAIEIEINGIYDFIPKSELIRNSNQ
jgi:hypothetical protein